MFLLLIFNVTARFISLFFIFLFLGIPMLSQSAVPSLRNLFSKFAFFFLLVLREVNNILLLGATRLPLAYQTSGAATE